MTVTRLVHVEPWFWFGLRSTMFSENIKKENSPKTHVKISPISLQQDGGNLLCFKL